MVAIKNVLLTTQITALEVKLRYVFLGEGQYLHIHNLDTGNRLATHKVFEAAVVHGIKIRPVKNEESRSWVVGVWGQKSLAVLLYKCQPGNEICSLIDERRFEDWIIDAALEDDLSHIVLATAHNSLIRYKLQYSKDLEEFPYQDTSLESEGNCLVHEGKEDCVQNKSHLDCNAIKTDTNSLLPKTELLTWKNTRWKQDRCVLVKVDCTENCILYCGHIVLMAGNWESAVLLAGTVFSQVLIWGPWCCKDPGGRVPPIHCLSGHEGVLFSINFSVAQGLLTTTSDDRTLRMWNIIPKYPLSDANSPTSLQLCNREQAQQYWLDAEITEKHICYGHGARVWQSLILSSCVVSVGEDSKVCVWDQQGKLVTWWKAHDGSCVWKVAAAEDEGQLVTGGGDGSVKTWSLNITDSPKSEPLLNGPWCLTEKETPFIENEHSKVTDASLQLPASEYGEGDKAEMLKNGELFEVIKFEGTETTEPCTKNNLNQLPKATDFPRCVALVGVNQFLLAMDSGRLFQWHSENATWTLVCDDPRMRKYVIMDTCLDQKKVAVGMLCGVVLIFRITGNGNWEKHLEATLCQGKVFSLLWLGSDRILACGPDGDIVTWSLLEAQGSLVKERNHILPPCKQRWVSAACIVPSTFPGDYYLICGDRAGSLHLYHQEDSEPRQSIRGIHGKNGVTSLVNHEGFIYSTGRDGCVRQLKLFDKSMQVLTVTRVSNVTWVAQVIFLQGRPLALCFHDVNLKFWNLAEDRAVVEVECGGGHRSWALHASRSDDQLVFFFLKDGIPCIFRTTLADKLMPLIKSPVNTRETMCLQTLFHVEGKTFFAMGGEDTTLRIHSVHGLESHRSLCVVRSHISNIRALCRIECQGAVSPAGSDKSVWLVSGGGRAQMKLWEVTLNPISQRNLLSAGSGLQGKVPEAGSEEENSYQQEQAQEENTSVTCNSSREKMLNVGCREVTSHMIRTGNNKTWKSQELTFDPETRYMDATAFWVTDQLAVIVLASSDGILRVFVFSQCTEKVTLVCSRACDHCLLKVVRVPIQTRHILASAGTDGRVVFWDMKSIVNWLCTPDVAVNNPPPSLELHQLAFIQSHQSGVNSLSINNHSKPTEEKSYRSLTLATGGDDNKLSVWDVIIDTSEDGFTKIAVQFLCTAIGHASQITGLEWISLNLLVSTSVDQRVVVWELCRTDSTRPQSETGTDNPGSAPQTYLRATGSAYTGVPDVKGLTAIPINKNSSNTNNSETDLLQRLFVYGVGLQVYDLDTSVGEL